MDNYNYYKDKLITIIWIIIIQILLEIKLKEFINFTNLEKSDIYITNTKIYRNMTNDTHVLMLFICHVFVNFMILKLFQFF
jgi:hypothetical protein